MDRIIQIKKNVFLPVAFVLVLVSFLGLRTCTNQMSEIKSKQLTSDFTLTRDTNADTSQVLVAKGSQVVDVSGLMWEGLAKLDQYFNGTLEFKAGFLDKKTNFAQGFFTAQINNQPIEGIVVVGNQPEGSVIWAVYDRAGALANSLPQRVKSLASSTSEFGGSPPGSGFSSTLQSSSNGSSVNPQSLHWNEIHFPDGSGSVALPDGWRLLDARKGAMRARGPDEATVELGQAFPINLPGSLNIPGSGGSLFAPYAPPAQALFTVSAEVSRVYGSGSASTIQLIEQYPYPVPSGQGAFLHFIVKTGGQGQVYRALASVITIGQNQNMWVYYASQISAPEPVFSKYFPVMMQIWRSWKVSGRVNQERLDEALANLREMGQIAQTTAEQSEQARANAHSDWIEAIRSEGFLRDINLNEVYSAPLESVDKYVEAGNLQDSGRYEVLRRRDITPP